jgi:hypothetical protein
MDKRKILIVGLIGLLLAGGLMIVGCSKDSGCQGYGDCEFVYTDGATTKANGCGTDSCAAVKGQNPGPDQSATYKCDC